MLERIVRRSVLPDQTGRCPSDCDGAVSATTVVRDAVRRYAAGRCSPFPGVTSRKMTGRKGATGPSCDCPGSLSGLDCQYNKRNGPPAVDLFYPAKGSIRAGWDHHEPVEPQFFTFMASESTAFLPVTNSVVQETVGRPGDSTSSSRALRSRSSARKGLARKARFRSCRSVPN